MFRYSTVLRRTPALFAVTTPKLLWFKSSKKEVDDHRQARTYPWWRSIAIAGSLVLFVNVGSVCFYFGNRWYQSWRPSGNDLYVISSIDEKVFERPDLAVVAVRMLIHHVLSNSKTPFGSPMVAPKEYESEANELLDLVLSLHEHEPQFSVPDLWTLVTAKALARLGGPNVGVLRGRDDPDDLEREHLLTFPPAAVSEDNRDVLNLKRALAKQQYSIEQLVALIGCARNIGFHEGAHFHTHETVKPLMRRPNVTGPTEDEFHLPDTTGKCTVDPYVFGSEYFDLLLDYNWKQHGLLKKDPFYSCSEKSRVRDVVLIDPFSAQQTEKIERIVSAEEKHKKEVKDYYGKNSSVMEGASPAELSKLGRTGEAQMIPGKGHMKAEEESKPHVSYETEEPSKHIDPCQHISMRGIDVMLLDDALTKGWLHRFSSNEVDFYSTVSDLVLDVQRKGHNENKLYAYHK